MHQAAGLLLTLAGAGQAIVDVESIGQSVPLPMVMAVVGAIFLGTLAISRFSLRIGLPGILGVLLLGLVINADHEWFSPATIDWLHTLSLSMLLFYAGLRTELRSIRGFLEYGILLAVGGVIVSSALLGVIICFVASPTASGIELGFGQIPFGLGLLLAACLGSTDAGATIAVLRQVRDRMPKRLIDLLEFESSVNDPAAILFFGLVLGLSAIDPGTSADALLQRQLSEFVQRIGSGLMVGVLIAYLARLSLEWFVDANDQLLVLGVAVALIAFGTAELLGGSGFIATYATGAFLSNHIYRNRSVTPAGLQEALLPFNTMTEITVFLLFGLRMNPARLLPGLSEGVIIALALMLVTRPLSVLLFQRFSPFSLRESLLIGWCGLRGALPLVLTFKVVESIPLLRGVDPALVSELSDNADGIIFKVVVLNLLIQGMSLPLVCRWLGLQADGLSPPAAPPAGAGGG
ncbi:MAG: cation:proton antiporter [Cyanobium sp.]